jgi:translocation and assembly module TamB
LGFRQFKIDPFLAGQSNTPTARVTLERRLNSNLSVTYSTDITTAQNQVVLIEYIINPKYSLVASRDENGKMGLDIKIQKKF